MRVKRKLRIFGAAQSFLSYIYSEPSPFLPRYKVYKPLYSEKVEEATSKHIKSSGSEVSGHLSVKLDSLNLQNRQ